MGRDVARKRLLESASSSSQATGYSLAPERDEPKPRFKISAQSLKLFLLLLSVVVAGTANRVTFKVMQFGNINYQYFVSQFTTIVYIPVNLAVVLFKIFVTKTITPEMRKFSHKSLFIMGLLDSLQGLLIVIGGAFVPGMMQSLLLQGAVPVTMLCSLLLLRPRGCRRCKALRKVLKQHGSRLSWVEKSTAPYQQCTDELCVARVFAGNREMDVSTILTIDPNAGGVRTVLTDPMAHGVPLTLYTSGKAWRDHLRSFYSRWQYVGASVVVGGLLVSVWPSITGGSGAGPITWDIVFFLATVPTGLSAVYKEIAFRKVELDVWFLNLWVAIYQTLCTFAYFPLAAVMSDIPIKRIPETLYRGLMCYAVGRNFITQENATCSIASDCGTGVQCCDSCDGSFHDVSGVTAFWGLNFYMIANLMYNIVLVSVIKYGSAALMYIASTIVLPLSALCFALPLFLGPHAQAFTAYTTAGLIVVLVGLIFYRFAPSSSATAGDQPVRPSIALGQANSLEAYIPRNFLSQTQPLLRSSDVVRSVFYGRLGIGIPEDPQNPTPPSPRELHDPAVDPITQQQARTAEEMWAAGDF